MSTGPIQNPPTPQYPPTTQTRRTDETARAQEATPANESEVSAQQAQKESTVHASRRDNANAVRGVQARELPVDLGGHFSRQQVSRATRLVDELTNGKLSEAERTAKTLQFAESLRGMSDNQLMDVARYLGQNMAKFDGHDQTLNALFQNVTDRLDNKNLRDSLHGCDLREALKMVQVMESTDIITEMATGRNQNPEKLADQVLRFEQSLEGMSDDQLLQVASHIGNVMAKTDGNDPLLGRMLMLVMDRMEEPRGLLKDPIFDKLPLPDRLPPFPWPGTPPTFPFPNDPQAPTLPPGNWDPLPTPSDPLPPGIEFPDFPGPGGGGDPTLPPTPAPTRPGGPWGDFPWPTTPPTFPWPECPPDIRTFGDLREHLAQNS